MQHDFSRPCEGALLRWTGFPGLKPSELGPLARWGLSAQLRKPFVVPKKSDKRDPF